MKEVHTLGISSTTAEDQCTKQEQEEDIATKMTLLQHGSHVSLSLSEQEIVPLPNNSKVVLYSLSDHEFI